MSPALAGLLVAWFGLAVPAESTSVPQHIGRITIHNLNVFSPPEASRGWFYRTADALHVRTRPSLIRRFLLFRENDTYDPRLLAESERNLRRFRFLKWTSVAAAAPHGDTVDVEVTTQDSWTTEPTASYGFQGGRTTYECQLKEKNLLGTGRELILGYARQTDRIVRSLEYSDPGAFGAYWNADLGLAANSDGHEQRLQIERPFYSFTSTRHSRLAFDNLRQNVSVCRDAELWSRFRQDHTQLLLEYGIGLATSPIHATRLTLGVESLDDRFQRLPDRSYDTIPDARRFRYLYLRLDDVRNDFLKLNYVNRDQRYEDFNLAPQLSAWAALSPSAFRLRRTTLALRAQTDFGLKLAATSFVVFNITFETRWDRLLRNEILSGSCDLVHKWSSPLIQTTVARLQYTQGWRLDRDVQFLADGENGLRGYRLHAFAGDRRLIANFEHRIFVGREFLQLLSPGAAVFVDVGSALPPGGHLRFGNMKSDVGAGLRLGIPRAAEHNVIRIDFAYALNRDPHGKRGWLVSFGEGQTF